MVVMGVGRRAKFQLVGNGAEDGPMETDEPQTKDALLARIRDGRSEFDTVLLAVPPEAVNEPVFAGGWSIKDLVTHIAAYEQWTAAQIMAAQEGRRATDEELYGVDDVPE